MGLVNSYPPSPQSQTRHFFNQLAMSHHFGTIGELVLISPCWPPRSARPHWSSDPVRRPHTTSLLLSPGAGAPSGVHASVLCPSPTPRLYGFAAWPMAPWAALSPMPTRREHVRQKPVRVWPTRKPPPPGNYPPTSALADFPEKSLLSGPMSFTGEGAGCSLPESLG